MTKALQLVFLPSDHGTSQGSFGGISTSDTAPLPQSIKGILLRTINGTVRALFLRNDRNEWELPGGKLEPGEHPEECLARELGEEAGLRVKVGPCVHSGILPILPPHVPEMRRVSIAAYGCFLEDSAETNPAIVLSDEHCGARWIGIDDLASAEDVPEIYKTSVLNWHRELGSQIDKL